MSALTATPLCTLQIEYNFQWLQMPVEKKLWERKGYCPLAAVNVTPFPLLQVIQLASASPVTDCGFCVQAMVYYNRLELLNHPVCKKYLAMKWYGVAL